MSNEPLIRLVDITKSYPGVQALKGVSLEIRRGEVHCLVGENGAGKSTLIRILSGATRPDAGTIEVRGHAFHALDPASGCALGISAIYQELDLVPAMSVAENLFLGHEPTRRGLIDRRAMQVRARAILSNFDVPIAPEASVRELGPAERQLVQIGKALSHDSQVLILDEPTASLTGNEVQRLFALLERLRREGMAIVYISHRLEEVLHIGDCVTVLRDGAHVLTRALAGASQDDLIEAMVGRRLSLHGERLQRAPPHNEVPALEVRGLTRQGEFSDISFSVHYGEVLGLAGLIGAGRSALLETLFGLRRADRGEVLIEQRAVVIHSPRSAIDHGLGLVPEERRESGVLVSQSVAENLVVTVVDRYSGLFGLKVGALRALAERWVAALKVKAASLKVPVGQLSGGNQQKVAIGKWLAADVRILLLDEPTRGVDVHAKLEIYRLIDELAARGAAVIVASSELPELLALTDRIVVLAGGRQTAVLRTADTGEVEIMTHAFAQAPTAQTVMP